MLSMSLSSYGSREVSMTEALSNTRKSPHPPLNHICLTKGLTVQELIRTKKEIILATGREKLEFLIFVKYTHKLFLYILKE